MNNLLFNLRLGSVFVQLTKEYRLMIHQSERFSKQNRVTDKADWLGVHTLFGLDF